MTLRFQIHYHTENGQSIGCRYAMASESKELLPLVSLGDGWWEGSLELKDTPSSFTYSYVVIDSCGAICREEPLPERKLPAFLKNAGTSQENILSISDTWIEEGIEPAFLRSAFTHCVYRIDDKESKETLISTRHALLLCALPPPQGHSWAVMGRTPHLGAWQPGRARKMQRLSTYEWVFELTEKEFAQEAEYKYVLQNDSDHYHIVWETGENRRLSRRVLSTEEIDASPYALRRDFSPRIALRPWRGAGVVIPVFSLRSDGSQGVGDFGDLCKMIDWADAVGMRAVQLLPINDTTTTGSWRDSYPYNAISVFALHPLYLDLREWQYLPLYQKYNQRFSELNRLNTLDYEATLHAKTAFLKELFEKKGKALHATPDYQRYTTANAFWLIPYARFCLLRDQYRTANFREWKEEAPTQDTGELQSFPAFVQYLLHRQMEKAHKHARSKGIILKGDIPIGVCRDSVPAWADARLFNFNGQAGAPPDDFSQDGQNWGFPTYDWDYMASTDYSWWRRRLQVMGRYFDAYRMDHVLGFFRIWEIPIEQHNGILGHFRPSLPLSTEEIRSYGLPFSDEQIQLLSQPTAAAESDPANVLFIADCNQPNHYHPRIAAQRTARFQELSQAEQAAYNRMYDCFFYQRHDRFWADEAMKKLPALIGDPFTDDGLQLPCAEDLGMVPASVKGVLEQLHILSLEIQRMPKTYGRHFDDTSANPYLSVATIATHDMPPLRLWWQTNREDAQRFWKEVLQRQGDAPLEADTETCEAIIRLHLSSPSMLCLLSWQDWTAIDAGVRHPHPETEQINVPSNPHHYWNYRMHLTLEELEAATAFNRKVSSLIKSTRQ